MHVDAGVRVDRVGWWRTRAGTRILPRLDLPRALIDLPDAPTPTTVALSFVAPGRPRAKLLVHAQTRTDEAGRVYLLVAGSTADDRVALASLVTLEPDGRVGRPRSVPFFLTTNDPGSPTELQIALDDDRPVLVTNRDDHTAVLSPPLGADGPDRARTRPAR